jgi:elongation factor 1-beta
MADVGIILKIMPNGVEVDLDALEKKLNKLVKPHKIERKPIAFGLNALIVTVIMEEAPGGTDKLEETVHGIDGVGEVSVESVSRLVG